MNPTVLIEQTGKAVGIGVGRQYVTRNPDESQPVFTKYLDAEPYAEALSGLVVKCVDVLVYDPETAMVLIGTRQQEPQAGDWVIGGRMRAGESLEDSAIRNLQREIGLNIDPKKLRQVGDYELIWDTKAQPTTTNEEGRDVTGCHMSSKVELYPVTPEEKASMVYNDEYAAVKWVDPLKILNAPEGAYHPCLVDMVKDGLEVITTPDEPVDTHEQHVRIVGHIATLNTKLNRLEQYYEKS